VPLTPKERSIRGRIGAFAMHSKNDSRQTSAAGRATFMAGFETRVDPERRLPEKERKRRAAQARKAYFAGLALRSAKVRRQRKANKLERRVDEAPLDEEGGPREGRQPEPDHRTTDGLPAH
jgi:hypothetical protein